MTLLRAGLAAALVVVASPAAVAAQSLRYEGGAGLTSGSYVFSARTTSWSFYSGLSLSAGRFFLRAGVPAYMQNSTLVAGSSTSMIPTGGSSDGAVADSGQARKQRGGGSGTGLVPLMAASTDAPVEVPASASTSYRVAVGDPTAQAGFRLLDNGRSTLAFQASVKAPVSDTATFGTGQWDYGAGAIMTARIGSRALVGVDVSYWHLGDMPDLPLRDPVAGSAALSYQVADRWWGGAVLSGSSAVLDGFSAPVSVGGSVNHIATGSSMGLLVSVGLTPTAPDLSVGLHWGIDLFRRD